jgi:hypothetical protein
MNETNPYAAPESPCLDAPRTPEAPREDPPNQEVKDWSLRRRLMVTLSVILLIMIVGIVRIPLIRWDGMSVLGGAQYRHTGSLNLFYMGLKPLVTSFVLVEIAFLVSPTLRWKRLEGSESRAEIRLLAIRLSFVFMVLWAIYAARDLQRLQFIGFDALSFLLVAITMGLGSLALYGLIRFIDRRGLGNGFSIVLSGVLLSQIIFHLRRMKAPSTEPGSILVGIALVTLIIVLVFKGRPAPEADSLPRFLPIPTSGIQPLILPALLLGLLVPTARLFQSEPLAVLATHLTAFSITSFVFTFLLCLLFSFLFNWPSHVREAWTKSSFRDRPGLMMDLRSMFWRGFASTAVLTLAALFLQLTLNAMHIAFDLVSVFLLIVIGLDVAKEWRFRGIHREVIPIWEMQRVHAVVPVMLELKEAGIPAFAKGFWHRSLLQFFGPMVPIEILVLREQEEEARTIVRQLVGANSGTESQVTFASSEKAVLPQVPPR